MISLSYCAYLLILDRLEKKRAATRKWRLENPQAQRIASNNWKSSNRVRVKAYEKSYRKLNLAEARARDRKRNKSQGRRDWYKNKCRADENFRLRKNLGARIWKAIQGTVKSARTLELLGCSVEQLKTHLEKQFRPDMTWENYGPIWHIDHIKPCAKFDLTRPEQQRECFHYSNLQPLWATDNLTKGDSWPLP